MAIANVAISLIMWYVLGILSYKLTVDIETNYLPDADIPMNLKCQRIGFILAFMFLTVRMCSLFVILYHISTGYRGIRELTDFKVALLVIFMSATIVVSGFSFYLIISTA